MVTRKEELKLDFRPFSDAKSFRDQWISIRREVTIKCGRRELAGTWFDEIENHDNTFEYLGASDQQCGCGILTCAARHSCRWPEPHGMLGCDLLYGLRHAQARLHRLLCGHR